MTESSSNQVGTGQEELDLGQIISIVSKGFQALFKGFLKLFLYLKRNLLWLFLLVLIGALLGYGWSTINAEKLKLEVIVRPNLESKYYLYDVVEEINGKIKSEAQAFGEALGIDPSQWKGFEIGVEPVLQRTQEEMDKEQQYLETLKAFQNSPTSADIIRGILLDQNNPEQRITFYYINRETGPGMAKKIMNYINSNAYYKELAEIYRANANARLAQNDSLIAQIDRLVQVYSEKIGESTAVSQSPYVVEDSDALDVPALLQLKNNLIAQKEVRKIELLSLKEPLNIINFGSTQPVDVPFFGKAIIQVPTILLGLFFLFGIVRYLNRRAKELI